MATNSDNLQRYLATLSTRNPKNFIFISTSLPIAEHIRILCGPPDLTGTELTKSDSPTSTPKIGSPELAAALKSKNPYERARAEVLTKMTDADKKLIMKMEAENNLETSFYKEFLSKVSKLGDKLSEEKS